MYKDFQLSAEQRAKDLLSKMTLDEKINEMNLYISMEDLHSDITNNKNPDLRGGCFGSVDTPDIVDRVQKQRKTLCNYR